MDIMLLLRWLWFTGSLCGLLLTIALLWYSLGDLEAVRKAKVKNGRRLLAMAGLWTDLALITAQTGHFGLALLSVFAPLTPRPPDELLWIVVRTVIGLLLPTWVLAVWQVYRLRVRWLIRHGVHFDAGEGA